jgi:hypothetical protein
MSTANPLPPPRWAIEQQRLSDALLPTFLAGLAVAGLTSCVTPSTRRIHAENMTKAEEFKRKFERDIPRGTPFEDVATYLKGQGLQHGLTARPENHYVELLREKSPDWFCGEGSVGLVVHFRDNKLDRAETTFWSFDCP